MSTTPFTFAAQTTGGEPLAGTIEASDPQDADRRLRAMQLRVISLDLEPPPTAASRSTRRLGPLDFQLFNTQLAHLSAAGLPVEHGLRLIADDARSGRLARAVRAIAADLETGRPLAEVLQQHAGSFPPLYGQIVNAGIRTGNLPGVLLNLGRHLELIARMRASLWKAFTYPAFVMATLIIVLLVVGLTVFPQYAVIFSSFHTELPAVTELAIGFSQAMIQEWKWWLVLIGIATAAAVIGWQLLGRGNGRERFIESVLFRLPLIGRALRWNVLARWTDALKLGIEAGLDLPGALDLAAGAVGSPALRRDGQTLAAAVQAGRPLDQTLSTRLLPPSLVAVLSLASGGENLPGSLETLSTMFQQQAEVRISLIPTTVTPVLILLIAAVVVFTIIALFAPMISLVQAVSG